MNQILDTGEENLRKKVNQTKKVKRVLPVNVIVVFFALGIIILGICMISGSVYAKDKINEVVLASAKPQVDITRNDDDNTVEINVNLNRWRKHINSYNSRRKWTISNIRKEIPSWKYSSYKIRSCIKWSKTNSNK